MDYVLSISDNLFFDYLYAKALPFQCRGLVGAACGAADATAEAVKKIVANNDPLSQYFGLEPSQYAVMSELARDDWRRQVFSLFLITW